MEKHKAYDEMKKVENLHDVEMTHDELEHSKAVMDVKIKNRGVLQGEVQDHNIVVVGVATDVFSDGQDQVVCVQTAEEDGVLRHNGGGESGAHGEVVHGGNMVEVLDALKALGTVSVWMRWMCTMHWRRWKCTMH